MKGTEIVGMFMYVFANSAGQESSFSSSLIDHHRGVHICSGWEGVTHPQPWFPFHDTSKKTRDCDGKRFGDVKRQETPVLKSIKANLMHYCHFVVESEAHYHQTLVCTKDKSRGAIRGGSSIW